MHHLSGGPAHKLFPCPSREAAEDPKGPHLKIPQVVDDTSINRERERERAETTETKQQQECCNNAISYSLASETLPSSPPSFPKPLLHLFPTRSLMLLIFLLLLLSSLSKPSQCRKLQSLVSPPLQPNLQQLQQHQRTKANSPNQPRRPAKPPQKASSSLSSTCVRGNATSKELSGSTMTLAPMVSSSPNTTTTSFYTSAPPPKNPTRTQIRVLIGASRSSAKWVSKKSAQMRPLSPIWRGWPWPWRTRNWPLKW